MRRVFVGWLTCTYLYWVYQNPNDASTFILQSNLSRILLWFAGVVFSKRLSDSCMGHTKNCICIVSLEICTCNTSKWITLTINNMLYLYDHLNRNKSTIFADTCAIHAWQSWYTLSLHRSMTRQLGAEGCISVTWEKSRAVVSDLGDSCCPAPNTRWAPTMVIN